MIGDPSPVGTCPTCGRCPTCGSAGYVPYWQYVPWQYPFWNQQTVTLDSSDFEVVSSPNSQTS